MGVNTAIQWTDNSHNFWEGCNKVDADCKYCYAERMFARFGKDFATLRKIKNFDAPLKWKEPKKIFTCSTSDFFHIKADEWRNEAWDIIRKCPQHTFQILTKRPERIVNNLPGDWNENFSNCWIGTSVGSEKGLKRIYDLMWAFDDYRNGWRKLRKPVTFISFEPLYEFIDCNFDISTLIWFDWIIVGGESGNETGKYRYRPCQIEWIEEIIKSFSGCGAAIFVKQLGTYLSKQLKMSDRHGGNIEEFPKHLQIRQFPNDPSKRNI